MATFVYGISRVNLYRSMQLYSPMHCFVAHVCSWCNRLMYWCLSQAVVTVERKKFIPRNGAQFTEKFSEVNGYCSMDLPYKYMYMYMYIYKHDTVCCSTMDPRHSIQIVLIRTLANQNGL